MFAMLHATFLQRSLKGDTVEYLASICRQICQFNTKQNNPKDGSTKSIGRNAAGLPPEGYSNGAIASSLLTV